MSWLLYHPPTKTNVLFDLGVAKDRSDLPPMLQDRIRTTFKLDVSVDVFDSLRDLNIDLSSISTVILSHLHFDHYGERHKVPAPTKFLLGPDSLSLLEGPGIYPQNQDSFYSADLFPRERTGELPPRSNEEVWKPLGPFQATHDYFGDGSLYIVDSPGHLIGHINLLVRVGPEKWVYLAADSCHDKRLLSGECEIAYYEDKNKPGKMNCAHENKEAAAEHLARVRQLQEMGVEVILAHDWEWLERNRERFG
jgi:glyoxylase-like metal-dependent hydrolase (beta-lactamase superfamily II)